MKLECDIFKRITLTFPFLVIPFLILFTREWYLNFYIVSGLTCVSSYLFFMNFPYVSKIMHTKGLNYEDLADKQALTTREKEHYQKIFIQIINVPLAIFITGLVDYALFRFTHTVLNLQEVVGIIGGLGSAYVTFHELVGQLLIAVLHKSKVKKVKRRESEVDDRGDIELTEVVTSPSEIKICIYEEDN